VGSLLEVGRDGRDVAPGQCSVPVPARTCVAGNGGVRSFGFKPMGCRTASQRQGQGRAPPDERRGLTRLARSRRPHRLVHTAHFGHGRSCGSRLPKYLRRIAEHDHVCESVDVQVPGIASSSAGASERAKKVVQVFGGDGRRVGVLAFVAFGQAPQQLVAVGGEVEHHGRSPASRASCRYYGRLASTRNGSASPGDPYFN
jgi:hypothetical protein